MNLVYGMDESSHAEDLEDKKGADLNKNEFDFTNVHFLFPKMFFYPLDLVWSDSWEDRFEELFINNQ
uniref:Uncharacterized protein n=1 Tax=Rhizophora mucronata TaxID=61149 RepID=A0A2P2MVZ2_RHIMU